jgi:hypothetical protein
MNPRTRPSRQSYLVRPAESGFHLSFLQGTHVMTRRTRPQESHLLPERSCLLARAHLRMRHLSLSFRANLIRRS